MMTTKYYCPQCGSECTDYREYGDWGWLSNSGEYFRCERSVMKTDIDDNGKEIERSLSQSCGWFMEDEIIHE